MNVTIRDSNGRAIHRSRNLRAIRDYTQGAVAVERVDLFGPNKQGGGTLGIVWNTGATCLADFASYAVMREFVAQRTRSPRGIFNGTPTHERGCGNATHECDKSVRAVKEETL